MRIKVNNRLWDLVFVDNDPAWQKGHYGDCDACGVKGKKIRVDADLKGRDVTDVILHEILHAANFGLSEDFVEQLATDMARALWNEEVLKRTLDDPSAKKIILSLLSEDQNDSGR